MIVDLKQILTTLYNALCLQKKLYQTFKAYHIAMTNAGEAFNIYIKHMNYHFLSKYREFEVL